MKVDLFNVIICRWAMLLCSILLSACATSPYPEATVDAPIISPHIISNTTNASSEKIIPRDGAAVGAGKVRPVSLPSTVVEYHVWQPLTSNPAEVWHSPRFKMYTYVLFNSAIDASSKLSYQEQRARLRLNKLLESIGRTEDRANTPENQTLNLQASNVFLIPSDTDTLSTATIEHYRITVARLYLDYFGRALATNKKLHQKLHQQGPFLVSTLKPIGEILKLNADGSTYQVDSSQPILLVDMTSAHEKSIVEIVRTFKNYVADESLTGISAFEPMRLKLVSLLLKLNDAIPMVNNAVAGTCNLIGAAEACPK